MGLLATGPLSKQELAERLGFDHITGHLNRTVKGLRVSGRIRYTIPEKPNTRFQKYERIDR
jgi:ATP-dependent DNA helicase RecG